MFFQTIRERRHHTFRRRHSRPITVHIEIFKYQLPFEVFGDHTEFRNAGMVMLRLDLPIPIDN